MVPAGVLYMYFGSVCSRVFLFSPCCLCFATFALLFLTRFASRSALCTVSIDAGSMDGMYVWLSLASRVLTPL